MIRAFRDEVLAAINVKNPIDVRSPDEFWQDPALRTCRRNKASGPDTSGAINAVSRPTRTAPRPMRSWLLLHAGFLDNKRGSTAESWGIVPAHLVCACNYRTPKRRTTTVLDRNTASGGRPDRVGK